MQIRYYSLSLCSFVLGTFLLVQMVSAQSKAEYELTFDATWSAQTHPDRFPTGRNPHFTSLIGGTHNESVTFWEVGSTATSGIESMAETGSTGGVRREVESAIAANHAKDVLSGPSVTPSPNSVTMTFSIDSRWSMVTLTSMLAPSPDWFIGVSGLDLLDEDGEWLSKREVELFAYDAGSEDGNEYSLSNPDTQPKENIRRIEEAPFVVNGETRSVGTFVFELKSTKSIEVSSSKLTMMEGQSEEINVKLSSAPSGSVNVSLSSSHPDQITIDPRAITFTSTNYSDNVKVTITSLMDDDSDDLTGASITLTASGGGYDDVSHQVTVNVDDITLTDPTIEINPDQVSIDEGETESFAVTLSERPTSDVTITISEFENSDFTRSPESLTFTSSNFDQSQTVEIALSEDDDAEDDLGTLTLTANGGGYDGESTEIRVTGVEDDLPDAMLIVDQTTLNVPPGGFRIFTVTLSERPTGNVTVMIPKFTTPGLTANRETIMFTPARFQNPENVIIRASDNASESEPETITLTADDGGFDNASASIRVSIKQKSIPTISLVVTPNPVTEGETADIELRLSEQVDDNVIIPLLITDETSEPEDYDVSTELLVYIGMKSSTVVLHAKEDDDQENETLTVSLGDLPESIADAVKPDPVQITIKDNDVGLPTAVFIHNAHGDSVDVYMDNVRLIEGFSFQQTHLKNLTSAEINLDIVQSGSENNENPLHTYTFSPQSGVAYQLIVQRSNDNKLSLIDLNRDEPVDSENKVNIRTFHGAPEIGRVTLHVLDAENSSPIDSLIDMSYEGLSRYISLDRKSVNIAIYESSTGREIEVYNMDLSQSMEESRGLFLLSGKGKSSTEGFSPFGVWSSGIKIVPSVVTNVEDHPILDVEGVSVDHYPNPFVHNANLWFDLPETADIEIQVVDILGRTTFSTRMANHSGSNQHHEIDTSGWTAGVYLYRVIITSETTRTVSTGKMTKLR